MTFPLLMDTPLCVLANTTSFNEVSHANGNIYIYIKQEIPQIIQ